LFCVKCCKYLHVYTTYTRALKDVAMLLFIEECNYTKDSFNVFEQGAS